MTDYKECRLCPRQCGTDRNIKTGYCNEKSDLHISRAALHMWEEPCISGSKGSGTVFFSGCNMGCVFCQNRKISRGEVGKTVSDERLVEIFFELEQGKTQIRFQFCYPDIALLKALLFLFLILHHKSNLKSALGRYGFVLTKAKAIPFFLL